MAETVSGPYPFLVHVEKSPAEERTEATAPPPKVAPRVVTPPTVRRPPKRLAPADPASAHAKHPTSAGRPPCQTLRKDGQPCTAPTTRESGFTACPFHSPGFSDAEKALWRERGGYRSILSASTLPDAPDPKLCDPDAISAFLDQTAGRVLRGQISPGIGQVLKGLADSSLRAYEMALGRRLADLEALVLARAKRVPAMRIDRDP